MHERRRASEPLRLGPFHLDLRARELRKDGQPIRLQDKPFELLVALTERPGEIVTRDELRRRLWPSDTFVVFDDSLNTAISKLRDALRDSADAPQFIQTVPRHGYRYIGPLDGNGTSDAVVSSEAGAAIETPEVRANSRLRTVAAFAVAAAVVAGSAWGAYEWAWASKPSIVRFQIRAPESTSFPWGWPGIALSPDGQQIAFVAVSRDDRISRVWLQSLATAVVRPLAGTEGTLQAAWSPDGHSLALVSNAGVKRYDVRTAATVALCETRLNLMGISWSAASGLLLGPGMGHALIRVAADGGPPTPITTLDASREEIAHAWPQWLPDGRSFIYLALSTRPGNSGIYLARAGTPGRQLILAGGARALFTEPGFLVYPRGDVLIAQRFDPERGTLDPHMDEVASGVRASTTVGAGEFSVAPLVLAHATKPRLPRRELVWATTSGQRISTLGAADHYVSFSLSPDGRFAVLQRNSPEIEPPAPDLWLLDLVRNVRTRVTDSPGNDEGGVWSPDSRRFAYARHRLQRSPSDIYIKDVDDPESDHPLLADEEVSKHPFDWSPDGRFILYGLAEREGRQDVWVLPMETRQPFPWLATRFDEAEARFSPNGKWVAYQSDETGRMEVFVRAFDPAGSRWQISAAGGSRPEWRHDGKELYFVSADDELMAAAVRPDPRFEAEAPRRLFEFRRLAPIPVGSTPYAVSRDGRFLVGTVIDEGSDPPITIVVNWTQLLSGSPSTRR